MSHYLSVLNVHCCPPQKEFGTVPLSLMQTFVMMVGELNYQNNFLDAYLKDELPFTLLTFLVFVHFVLFMPILLVNLMVSLFGSIFNDSMQSSTSVIKDSHYF